MKMSVTSDADAYTITEAVPNNSVQSVLNEKSGRPEEKNALFAKNNTVITLICCWLTYMSAYLCRVNFSSAMSTISSEDNISVASLGTIGSAFFFIYAIGQLVNGIIGDRVNPSHFVIFAFSGTALCNLLVGNVHTFAAILFFWGLNGYFQSIFWSTIIRLLALHITKDKRAAVSTAISTAMPAGYMVSWCVLGQYLSNRSARLYFLLPAFFALIMIAVWIWYGRHNKDLKIDQASLAHPGIIETLQLIYHERLYLIVIVCLLHGLIKEGIAFWTPLLISDVLDLNLSVALAASLLPIANLAGMFLSKWLLERLGNRSTRIIEVSFFIIFCICALLTVVDNAFIIISLMALISCMAFCNNTILMSFIPMQYTSKNMVASLVGFFDFSSYMGAAISSFVLGKIISNAGFSPLPIIWLCCALISVIIMLHISKNKHTGGVL